MRSEQEIKEKLNRLLELDKRKEVALKPCPTCGHMPWIQGTWMPNDYVYLSAEIASLNWVLGIREQLADDHT